MVGTGEISGNGVSYDCVSDFDWEPLRGTSYEVNWFTVDSPPLYVAFDQRFSAYSGPFSVSDPKKTQLRGIEVWDCRRRNLV